MAFADLAAYKAAIASPVEVNSTIATSSTLWINAGNPTPPFQSLWQQNLPNVGAAPGASVACGRTTTGARGQQNGGTGALFVAAVEAVGTRGGGMTSEPTGNLILADRLVHQSGLVGNITTTQTSNLPTTALPRYTSGVGVWAAIEFYANTGNGTVTASISYTNSDGTSGRTGYAPLGNGAQTGANTFRHMVVIQLQGGDVGIRSVESVTLTGTLAVAGSLGITLFRPLLMVPLGIVDSLPYDVLRGTLGGGLPEILDDACLWWILTGTPAVTTSGQVVAQLLLAEA